MVTKRFILFLALTGSLAACLPKKEEGSSVKFDGETTKALDELMTPTMLKTICSKTPVFFFFGNAEGIVAMMGDRQFEAASYSDKLLPIVRGAADDLRRALGRMPLGCETQVRDGKQPHALLVTVIDGPGAPDSQIRATWFNFDMDRARSASTERIKALGAEYSAGWGVQDDFYYRFENGEVKEGSGPNELFELSMPDAPAKITEYFLKQKPPKFSGEFKFDQTFYFFKTHGAEFYDADGPVDYATHYKVLRNGPGKPKGTAFLFDPHGRSGGRNQGSELYYPYVSISDCQRFAEATSESDPAPGELCNKCKAQLEKAPKLGAFAQCKYPGREAPKAKATADKDKLGMNTDSTLGMNTDSTLGMNTDSTLGMNTDSTLGMNTDSTLGMNTDSTLGMNTDSTLGMNTDSTLGMNTDSTLGMNTDSTLGMNTDSTLGTEPGAVEFTLGSGKGTVYTKKPSDDFPFIHHLGRAVVYSGQSGIEGTTSLSLPVAGTRQTPPFVVLDSCHGNPDIGTTLFQVPAGQPIVTVSNPNSMGMASINYSAITYAQYLALANIEADYFLNGWGKDEVRKAKELFDKHLSNEGIGAYNVDKKQTLPVDVEAAKLKRLEIQVIMDGKILGDKKAN